MKNGLKLVCAALSATMLLSVLNPLSAIAEETDNSAVNNTATAAAAEDGYACVSQSGNKALYFNDKTGALYINDVSNGCQWRSTPLNFEADENVKESSKMLYDSQLIITYADASGNTYPVGSKNYSVNKKGMTSKKIDGGVEVTYKFTKYSITVPVKFTLKDDAFTASVELNDIKEEDSKYRLISWNLLPYFNAGGRQDNGFMVVPDGSGAVINFNNGKADYKSYTQYIYGRDTSIAVESATGASENALLPVFGTSAPNGSSIAVITSGESRSTVNALVTSLSNSFNSIYSGFVYHDTTKASFNTKSWNQKEVSVFETATPNVECNTVTYFLLDKNASYVDMALKCQDYFTQTGVINSKVEKDSYPLYLDFYGSINAIKHVLGFPVRSEIALTKYSDAIDILEELKDGGIDNIVAKYDNWVKGGPETAIVTNAKASSVLGGKSKLKKLTSYMADNDIDGYFDVNVTDMYKSKLGYIKTIDSAKMLNQAPTIQYQFSLSTLQKKETDTFWYLLNPVKASSVANKVSGTLDKYDISGVSADSMVQKLYSSYDVKGMDRVSAQKLWTDSLEKLRDTVGSMISEKPNAYALPYSDCIISLPTQSTGYALTDYDIPFYQIVLHSKISYSTEPNNKFSDYDKGVLTALETGSSLQFEWIARNVDKIKDTQFESLYDDNYKLWIKDAIKTYKDIEKFMSSVSDKRITGHSVLQDHVRKTTYENGSYVIVNYNDYSVTIDGVEIAAQGYFMMGA